MFILFSLTAFHHILIMLTYYNLQLCAVIMECSYHIRLMTKFCMIMSGPINVYVIPLIQNILTCSIISESFYFIQFIMWNMFYSLTFSCLAGLYVVFCSRYLSHNFWNNLYQCYIMSTLWFLQEPSTFVYLLNTSRYYSTVNRKKGKTNQRQRLSKYSPISKSVILSVHLVYLHLILLPFL